MKVFIAVVVVMTIVFVDVMGQDCTKDKAAQPNLCQSATGKPICLQKPSKTNETVFNCFQCDPVVANKDCQCGVGEYCVSDRDSANYGSCQLRDYSMYDKACQTMIAPSKKLKNDKMFCGHAIYNEDETLKVVEWKGVCVQGKCKECAVTGFVSYQPQICPDSRSCINSGYIVGADSHHNTWTFLVENAISFLNMLWFLIGIPPLLIMCCCQMKKGELVGGTWWKKL